MVTGLILLLIILQWNARSLLSNGQEFKGFLEGLECKPDIICVEETWLKPNLDFVIQGYVCIRRDKEGGNGGGCATFVKQGISYREIDKGKDLEFVVVEVWLEDGRMVIVNFYNPCKRLELETLEAIKGLDSRQIIWCGDFNAHSTLWGGEKTDRNGMIVEDLMESVGLVCLNDGSFTRINCSTGNESSLDLTLVSQSLAGICLWEVMNQSTIGSDHYPIVCKVGGGRSVILEDLSERWIFGKAQWDKFREISESNLKNINREQDVELLNGNVREAIIGSARQTIVRKEGMKRRKLVPWWNDECRDVIRKRNKAFKVLKNTHNFQHFIEYKRMQAVVRKTIKESKRNY